MNPPSTRRILLAVTGLTPQVVTETLYALACRGGSPWIPDEIHLITTATGKENARLNLLQGEGWFHRLCRDYGLPPIAFTADQIQVLSDAQGQELDDIRTPEQNTQAADFITERVRRLTADPATELQVSIAGGRKTMGYYLGYALSLYGRPQDRLSHVLVSGPYETNRDFYYPTPYDHPIHSRRGDREITLDARNARVDLADIPFVRLREGLPGELLKGASSFSQTVAAAQCKGRTPQLVIDPAARTATAGGERLKLTNQNFALLLWMARRRLEGRGPLHCSKDGASGSAREFLDLFRELSSGFSGEFERAEDALKNGMDSTWFSPAKNRLHKALIHALGESGAQPYQIHPVGNRREALFGLTLDPGQIHIRD
ncbi:MAG: CRISPR-associated protein [Gammaproteobacteria bacterium RIFOXYA12_FULL_61_12]|nr:MAG: CRISPR-associated protein [Gammaproteobacteria bacterium RIFOXYD12_FULL_61_37]OGT93478.1 MAG: CRISPR-associated protein [Gammaproteobacteria bacterium RIFOXYA12_FULL_61_12]